MQEQFSVLINLRPSPGHYNGLPLALLNGSAIPRVAFSSVAFPVLPKLLLHETHLVRLELWKIPRFGYISPEAIVTGLAMLANFESLTIRFEFFPSLPNQEIRSPLPNAHRPSLSYFFWSKGDSEFLEDLLVWVDAPLLDSIWIKFFHQLKFVIPQLAHFMRRTTRFQPLNFNEAVVDFDAFGVQVKLLSPTQNCNEKSVL